MALAQSGSRTLPVPIPQSTKEMTLRGKPIQGPDSTGITMMTNKRLPTSSEVSMPIPSRIWVRRGIHVLVILILQAFFCPCFAGAEPSADLDHELIRDLGQTIKYSLTTEAANLEEYKAKLLRVERERLYLSAATNGYQLQVSSLGNLLLSSGAEVHTLQNARSDLKEAIIEIQKMVDEISPRLNTLISEKKNIDQQIQLIEKQLGELAMMKPADKAIPTLKANAKKLLDILRAKEKILVQIKQIHETRLESIKQLQESFSGLSDQFDDFIEKRKKQDLFERRKNFFRPGGTALLKDEFSRFLDRFLEMGKPGFWSDMLQKLWESAGLILVSLVIVFGAALLALTRLQKAAARALDQPLLEKLGKWHLMVLKIINRSFRLGGITVLVYLYSHMDSLYPLMPVLQLLKNFLYVWLISRWLILALSFWPGDMGLLQAKTGPVKGIIKGIRVFAWSYLLVQFALGQDSGILIFLRLAFASYIILWTSLIWKDIRLSDFKERAKTEDRKKALLIFGCKYFFYTLGGMTLLLDMIGYGTLSVHWLLSWGRTIALLLWWLIFHLLLKEWDHYHKEKSKAQRDEFLYDDYPVQWLAIRFGQLIWLISLVILILLAWGSQQTLLARIYQALAVPLHVGSMSFSVLGIVYAVLALLFTYALTRLWRWIFQVKFLNRSGMEAGLQDSITTITLYVIWMFGVLVALHVFGLNTASLAVAFGALGIGLGFGLQNIFNNFISGIILLFERPIQLGDDVEINGTWATVKKINFRSTVVQTYDNASLIIPNSQFISSEVTNWSFKDKRLRRKITVGVAYGSDVTLVRDTLLEIARTTPKILKYPKPDVLFRDFGDSALIFILRIWTDIDNMLKVETEVRFEIDRLFRERDIEISFPQRDIHIRSITDKRVPNAPNPEPESKNESSDNH
ncbi:mechanosensitive ion channel family protein [Desulfospira joergensenii]|uniref:mechanosensitive ion channel family protein n=1 Tax=Desulfospira joergensenii TaxID=53329 RepID=UPI0004144143|nr:mechanosensitive ion channel domain-containing protein [Desulfospira joergensenii]